MDRNISLTACQGVKICEVESSRMEATFLKQPPEELRKSNYFNITIQLYAENRPLFPTAAIFKEFLHEDSAEDTRNGILYSIGFQSSSDSKVIEWKKLYLTVLDASSGEPIRYEGNDSNPKMKKVLITHESICARCSSSSKISCGNRREAPADPNITKSGALQFFMKCNQNCLKRAGNPKDQRRFRLAFSSEDIMYGKDKIVAMSNSIFVHNNSKHNMNRKRKRKDVEREESLSVVQPDLMYVYPKIGMQDSSISFHSKEWCRDGVTFRCSGVELTTTSIIDGAAMTLYIPPSTRLGKVIMTLVYNGSPMFSFPYEIHNVFQSDLRKTTHGFLMLRSGEDPNGLGFIMDETIR